MLKCSRSVARLNNRRSKLKPRNLNRNYLPKNQSEISSLKTWKSKSKNKRRLNHSWKRKEEQELKGRHMKPSKERL
jgi:hypothetical protein